jgi:DNA (cytosine-5)-methyltransferase 1
MKAIDLYSGVGGWSLGLRLAGIEVVASYERWGLANETNFKNNHHPAQTVDIRRLDPCDLPQDIDFVVGSPPCTQFSFSNRGGNGDIDDGLRDIRCFLAVVDRLRPLGWVMENVPRVADILRKELRPDGALAEFAHLPMSIHVYNLEEFGLPQKRRRCFAGNFDHELLTAYRARASRLVLGDVLDALSTDLVVDPSFGITIPQRDLEDHHPEDYLDGEEERINRAAKEAHPIYNSMPFPDPRRRAVRTITATCTRVSRESIVIDDPENSGKFRRLTLRERATLQGFPISFQFFGQSSGQKVKMIGNAVPPVFTYLLAHAMLGTALEDVPSIKDAAANLTTANQKPPLTPPDRSARKFKPDRTFRLAIPSLRLKSGVRFELANAFASDAERASGTVSWVVRFIHGTSKDIRQLPLNGELLDRILRTPLGGTSSIVWAEIAQMTDEIGQFDLARMQQVWTRSGPGLTRPFMLLDLLDTFGSRLARTFADERQIAEELVSRFVFDDSPPGMRKLLGAAPVVAAGLIVGSCANAILCSENGTDEIQRMIV